jgi:hypothetical protein
LNDHPPQRHPPIRAIAPDDPVLGRSIRFALTVTLPVALAAYLGVSPWLIYALVTATVVFAIDTGGPAGPRLFWMAAGGAVIALGAALGAWLVGSSILLMAAFAVCGIIYGLTESAHPTALTLSRFLCFAVAIGAIYPPFEGVDLIVTAASVVLGWLISIGWDIGQRHWRPSTAPSWTELRTTLHADETERHIFASAVAITVPFAYWTSVALDIERPYWAMLTLVLVLRVDFIASRKLMIDRFLGTVLGVTVAGAYAAFFPSHTALMIGIVLAALARWPAQQQYDALGVGTLTAFVMLMIELVASSRGRTVGILEARILDTLIGCVFAIVAIGLDRALHWVWLGRARRA